MAGKYRNQQICLKDEGLSECLEDLGETKSAAVGF